eukprot:TRINITY_DN11801_c0_g1_i1.p1 TRINITY_DN11801_c0_g1~~TRINITY_DN11801_c0_g1_i1.p1  ORF type:complete len:341 (-),score=57.54 TRINITY_DN11801_c0_g1_i1:187-1209(-)
MLHDHQMQQMKRILVIYTRILGNMTRVKKLVMLTVLLLTCFWYFSSDSVTMPHINRSAVVVTGASSGIGLSTANYLRKLGFIVFPTVRSTEDLDGIPPKAKNWYPIVLEITDQQSILNAATDIEQELASLNINGLYALVNNAGISISGVVEFTDILDIREQFDVNFFGQIAVIQEFLPLIRKHDNGRIVNIGSVNSYISWGYDGIYSSSKFAFRAMNDALRRELNDWGIHVVMIHPGSISSEIWDKENDKSEKQLEHYSKKALQLYPELADIEDYIDIKEFMSTLPNPIVVAKKIGSALTTEYPKYHYYVGWNHYESLYYYLSDGIGGLFVRDSWAEMFL